MQPINLKLAYPFSQLNRFINNPKQLEYYNEYLTHLGVKTIILEKEYIDKDFLIDYVKFYSRSFGVGKKYTKRLHFFNKSISNDEFKRILLEYSDYSDNQRDEFNESYLGFIVIKPIRDAYGFQVLGRVLLKSYEEIAQNNGECRKYLLLSQKVSLFGIKLKFLSLPFQPKDSAVSVCGTIACWISQFALQELFGGSSQSPAEITEKSISIPDLGRNFPVSEINFYQIKNYFNMLGYETEFIDMDKLRSEGVSPADAMAIIIKAYLGFKLPIITGLELFKNGQKTPNRHAVVISGYRHNNDKITEIYTHDDTIGPYNRVTLERSNSYYKWKVKRWEDEGYSKINVYLVLIPLYPKIRLSFYKIYHVFLDTKNGIMSKKREMRMRESTNFELLLIELSDYKKFLLAQTYTNKLKILMKSFPKYLWIIRVFVSNTHEYDIIYDATSPFPKIIETIRFSK